MTMTFDDLTTALRRGLNRLNDARWRLDRDAPEQLEAILELNVKQRILWQLRRTLAELKPGEGSIRAQRHDSSFYSIFLSLNFAPTWKDIIIQHVRAICEPNNISLQVGDMSLGMRGAQSTTLETVIHRIATSEAVLAVYTPRPKGETNVWILSEVAMAMALKKPTALVIHEDVSPAEWKSVTGHFHQFPCTKDRPFQSFYREHLSKAIEFLDYQVTQKALGPRKDPIPPG